MFDKSSDLIVAVIPFVIVFLAGAIGIKSDVDLFDWWRLFPAADVPPMLFNVIPKAIAKQYFTFSYSY